MLEMMSKLFCEILVTETMMSGFKVIEWASTLPTPLSSNQAKTQPHLNRVKCKFISYQINIKIYNVLEEADCPILKSGSTACPAILCNQLPFLEQKESSAYL